MPEPKNGIRKYLTTTLISVLISCFLIAIGFNYANDSRRQVEQQEEIRRVDDCVRKVENKTTAQGRDIEHIRESVKDIKRKVDKIDEKQDKILDEIRRIAK